MWDQVQQKPAVCTYVQVHMNYADNERQDTSRYLVRLLQWHQTVCPPPISWKSYINNLLFVTTMGLYNTQLRNKNTAQHDMQHCKSSNDQIWTKKCGACIYVASIYTYVQTSNQQPSNKQFWTRFLHKCPFNSCASSCNYPNFLTAQH
jgi:hypothetical protein